MRKFCYLLLLLGLVMTQSVKADKTAKAIWTADNTTLTFVYDEATYNVGDAYGTGTVTNVWDPTVNTNYVSSQNGIDWITPYPAWIEQAEIDGDGVAGIDKGYNVNNPFKTSIHDVTKVIFDDSFSNVKPTSCAYWFFMCENLSTIEGLNNLNTSEATSMRCMFQKCSNANLKSLDLSAFSSASLTDVRWMFNGCSSLESITFGNSFKCENVISTESMFFACSSLENLDLSMFTTNQVKRLESMFYNCKNLKTIDVSNFNTSNVEIMTQMFFGCSSLTTLNLSSFDTRNVEDMHNMFYNCTSLENLIVGSQWSVIAENTNTKNMFFNTPLSYSDYVHSLCKVIWTEGNKTLTFIYTDKNYKVRGENPQSDLNTYNGEAISSLWEGSEVTSSNSSCPWTSTVSSTLEKVVFDPSFVAVTPNSCIEWFYQCSQLTTIEGMKYLNTGKVTSMHRMFSQCINLKTLDLSEFDTSNVLSFSAMFNNCRSIESLDLCSFNTSKANNMMYMLASCYALESIKISNGWNTDAVTQSAGMFQGSSKLVGGNGTTYNASYIDVTYAHADEVGNPGYLTLEADKYQMDITSAGMATLYYGEDLIVPENVEAWYCRSINDESSIVFAYPLTVIPANTGVFLTTKNNDGASAVFTKTTGTPAITNNIMVGTLTDTAVEPKSVLTLGHDQDGKLGFWYFTGTTIPAGRAYIPKSAVSTDAAAEARAYTVVFDESGESQTTGINNVNVNHNVDCYDLLGRRVAQPQKGLYIVNGKKVVIK